jgi:hypothetical protein
MSFDDVARRMKQRHAEGMLPLDEPARPAVELPPSADAFAQSLVDSERRARRSRDLAIGAVLFAVGLIITLATYSSASQSGGTYVIAYGPMVVGIIRIFRGLAA